MMMKNFCDDARSQKNGNRETHLVHCIFKMHIVDASQLSFHEKVFRN